MLLPVTKRRLGNWSEKYQGRLFNTLLHVVGRREEAEDVVQEAFVQAFVKLDTFKQKSAFYTWLYRIAFNVSVSRRRRKKVEISVDQHREQTGDEPRDASDGPGHSCCARSRSSRCEWQWIR